jgi:hypothetical protein
VATLLGPNWAVVPFANGASGGNKSYRGDDAEPGSDQHWHKDDNMPFNSRKMRHHRPIQLEILYYPQRVTKASGCTGTIPYSQYWHFNHEENHDNFAGADHLDLDFMYAGHESSPDLTDRDRRLATAPLATGWPLVRQHFAQIAHPASMLLMSHNLFHRGTRRHKGTPEENSLPRFMFRFMIYRTTDPDPVPAGITAPPPTITAEQSRGDWAARGRDTMTGIDLSAVPPPEHKYGYRDRGLTEIYLRF